MKTEKLNAADVEIAISSYIKPGNVIIPNVSWGFDLRHECDLLVVTKAGRLWEIEIKVSKSDIKADLKKRHQHRDERISRLYFAIPQALEDCIYLIPERAGVLLVKENLVVTKAREPKQNGNYVCSDSDRITLYRLGTLRIWGLKTALRDRIRDLAQIRQSQQLRFD